MGILLLTSATLLLGLLLRPRLPLPFQPNSLQPGPLSTTQTAQSQLFPYSKDLLYLFFFSGSTNGLRSGTLRAIQPLTGKQLWQYDKPVLGTAFSQHGILYFSTSDGINALSENKHTLLWHQNIQAEIASLTETTLTASRVKSPGLIVMNLSDGTPLWDTSATIDNTILIPGGFQLLGNIMIQSVQPGSDQWSQRHNQVLWSFDNQIIYTASDNFGHLQALRSSDGTTLWEKDNIKSILGSTQGILYTTNQQGENTLSALRSSDGTVLWQQTGQQFTSGLDIRDSILYLHGNNHLITALSATTGQIFWQATFQGIVRLNQNGVTYLTGDNSLLAIRNSDGMQLWQTTIQNILDLSINGSSLYTATSYNASPLEAWQLDTNSGKVLWHYQFPEHPEYLGLWQDTLYQTSPDGNTITAIRLNAQKVLWQYKRPST
ncbi:hypothetical protein KTT_32770 [Tengunoibacter tsumagoiensis]|uniref:Pyrrolo-quinoline quinone repeat domain-containing protein n=2 Tax=Tengunoibacter tsumagoiensis TaxID=2014871 RepID=A0A402A2P3_9CHLR|nr:hypothetical protein KTT_32770 [Tengunoibacter tsumagoiensis]